MTAERSPGPADGEDGRELSESERIEREEFARGHIDPGEEPVEPRPAATTVVARGGARGMELLFLRRPAEARFAAGAYVFPGGVIDPEDEGAALRGRLGPGVTRAEPDALVAALREAFEETGLLPADDLPPGSELGRAREALLEGETTFPALLRAWDLRFRGLSAAYFARWVTPARLSRRYDARFFLVEHRGGEPSLIGEEHTEAVWIDPGEALRRFETGDLPMLYPTRKTVERLAVHPELAGAMEAFRRAEVDPARPRLLVDGDAVVPVMPGEPGYEEAKMAGP